MIASHYTSSRGRLAMAQMPYPHLVNAAAKLNKRSHPSALQLAELRGLRAEIARRDAANQG